MHVFFSYFLDSSHTFPMILKIFNRKFLRDFGSTLSARLANKLQKPKIGETDGMSKNVLKLNIGS